MTSESLVRGLVHAGSRSPRWPLPRVAQNLGFISLEHDLPTPGSPSDLGRSRCPADCHTRSHRGRPLQKPLCRWGSFQALNEPYQPIPATHESAAHLKQSHADVCRRSILVFEIVPDIAVDRPPPPVPQALPLLVQPNQPPIWTRDEPPIGAWHRIRRFLRTDTRTEFRICFDIVVVYGEQFRDTLHMRLNLSNPR